MFKQVDVDTKPYVGIFGNDLSIECEVSIIRSHKFGLSFKLDFWKR